MEILAFKIQVKLDFRNRRRGADCRTTSLFRKTTFPVFGSFRRICGSSHIYVCMCLCVCVFVSVCVCLSMSVRDLLTYTCIVCLFISYFRQCDSIHVLFGVRAYISVTMCLCSNELKQKLGIFLRRGGPNEIAELPEGSAP